MPIDCKGVAHICDYPVAFDTYIGCEHACKYCFVKQHHDISKVKPVKNASALKSFIDGRRTQRTAVFDWNIPIKMGTASDPFQPCELMYGETRKCLEIFAETKYPFIIITKNPAMLTKEPYLSLIQQCRCVLTISMGCAKQDKLETGAIPYESRLDAIRQLSDKVTRINVRCAPYFPDTYRDILQEIPRWAEAGAYGAIFNCFNHGRKTAGMQEAGGSYEIPNRTAIPMYKGFRAECHKYGLRFFAEDAKRRFLSDNLVCCGTEGLDDFKPCTYNWCHLAWGGAELTAKMQEAGTGVSFRDMKHNNVWHEKMKTMSFQEAIHYVDDDGIIEWYKSLRREWDD